MNSLANYINKEIPFRFSGEDFHFALSHGLFSSNSIDAGTLLLLKSLAKPAPDSRPVRILDAGCGTGVLGICLKRKYSEAEVVLQDRDALACAFSRYNAEINKTAISAESALLLESNGGDRFDLVVSNIPAKAGEPVLRKFFPAAARMLTENGICAIVIVNTLADLAKETIIENGLEILFSDRSAQHTVFHFRGKVSDFQEITLADYIRGSYKFRLGGTVYGLKTVYNIPDFDTLGFRLRSVSKILERMTPAGDIIIWSPGQGHLPTALLKAGGKRVKSIMLTGRDLLELRISEHNLAGAGNTVDIQAVHAWALEALEPEREGFSDLLVIDYDPVPRTDVMDQLRDAAFRILRPGGELLLFGESQTIHRFYKNHKGFSVIQDYRNKGTRVLLLKRNS